MDEHHEPFSSVTTDHGNRAPPTLARCVTAVKRSDFTAGGTIPPCQTLLHHGGVFPYTLRSLRAFRSVFVVRTSFAILTATILLGGCQTVFNAVGVEQPLPVSESHNFNGSYQGKIKQVAQSGLGCPAEHGEKVLMVGDGVLWYAYTPNTLFTAPVNYDGTVHATSGAATFAGKIDGNHLDAIIQSPTCQTKLSMNFIYNHS
jgi:hypothetical protein